MTYEEAVRLVLHDGLAGEGCLVGKLHEEEDPGVGYVAELCGALRVIRAGLRGRAEIDGRLAYALFGLSYHVEVQHGNWIFRGRARPEGLDEALALLHEAVEDVFLAVAGDRPWED